MKAIISLVAVLVLFIIGMAGSMMGGLFGIAIPYIAFTLFLIGIVAKVADWAKSPVPFRITTTCGQQKSLDWIPHNQIDNPYTTLQAAARMALEVLTFRSLMKNTKAQMTEDKRLVYQTDIWLWLGALAFHYGMLIVVLRHVRLFMETTPFWVTMIERADGFFQVGVPVFYITSFLVIAGVSYLLIRRLVIPQVRYISLINDYFPLFLLLGITVSGFFLRYVEKTDIVAIKQLAVGLASFSPTVPAGISPLFFGHFFLVCVLLMVFPFSKLTHMAAYSSSPTRNLANNNRAVRHINPWNYPVKVHTYEEYEEEFGELMKAAGVPVAADFDNVNEDNKE